MNDWIQKNGISILIACVGIISTYTLYGYRLSALEAKAENQQETIATVQTISADLKTMQGRVDRQGEAISEVRDNSVELQVSVGKLQTDISYIRAQLDKVIN